MSTLAAESLPLQPDRPAVNPWFIALTVSMATFMEVLDTSIANVALVHIAGGLSAGLDESTWVLTSYLVSNAIILPVSGFFATYMGRKRFYMSCVALFTVSSLLCGLAPSLTWLIVFRVLQGLGGGGLQPSEQAILADTFEPRQRGMAFALYGVAVVVAPAIGPTLGGWITDNYTWRWIFFINVPVGILSLFLTYQLVYDTESAKRERRDFIRRGARIDYMGFGLVAIGLGFLQIVLDKGQQDDWLGSTFIVTLMTIALAALVLFVIRELTTDEPVVDLRLLGRANFGISNIVMFAMGFILFGTTQLLPQFVQSLLGYDATQAGLVISPGGVMVFLLMPVVGFLVSRVQPRWLVLTGVLLLAGAMWHMTGFDRQISYWDAAWARVYQASGLAFLFVPINTVAFTDLPDGKSSKASALINLSRNLGGSFGISLAQTLLARRTQFHQTRLVSDMGWMNPNFRHAIHHATEHFIRTGTPPAAAGHEALGAIYRTVLNEATMMSYIDVFWVMAVCSVCMIPLVMLMRKVDLRHASMGH